MVEAPTLKEALRQVRQRYGEDARVIRSRTLTRRQPGGLGQEKVVEVLVEPAGTGRTREESRRGAAARTDPRWRDLTRDIAAEVERIEGLVEQITRDQSRLATSGPVSLPNRLAETLVDAGADASVVARLCERCQAETGARPDDRTALLGYLARNLPTTRGDWNELGGTHVFLGAAGCGRSELVLGTAARLAADERSVLVLSLLPRHGGEIRRLQAEAAQHGYDAAVIQKPRQLDRATEHLSRYDVVLVDAPSFDSPVVARDETACRAIVGNPAFHRHLVLPLDRDLRDAEPLFRRARAWDCDWLALSRVDQTTLRGKILDVIDRMPLPLSVIGDVAWPNGQPELANADRLLDLMLEGAGRRAAARG
jgi:flagellar biosynthesis GTPase FlhF